MRLTIADVASTIEHTLLKAEATPAQVDALCDEASAYGFAGVCVNSVYVRRAVERLRACARSPHNGRMPAVVCPVGFPLGATVTATKADEARRALDEGASEIDMVAPIGLLIAGERVYVSRDIEAVASIVHRDSGQAVLKVILETAALTLEQLIAGCACCVEGGADFVKTSTGFHPAGGATVEDVRRLHRHAAPLKVKAAGGIRTAATATAMIEAGAARLGTSGGIAIIEEMRGWQT